MKLYNTMSREIEEVTPRSDGKVSVYSCGPTVYRFAHIGNLRTYITTDLLVRALAWQGWEVDQVMNITDVGHMTDESSEGAVDKMLLSVEDEGLSPHEIAERYTKAFFDDCDALNIRRARSYPKATDHIDEMIEITSKLIEKNNAYEVDGTVYFDIDSFPDYGRLSRNTKDKLLSGHRAQEADPNKRNHYDFTLWRHAGPRRLLSWDSPWGLGYPGWHIECSAMSLKYLGEHIDIHTGGSDHIFPHHECEIAQSEAYLGHQVVDHWVHAHHLIVDGEKMSKSLLNDIRIEHLTDKGYDPLAFRFLVMQARYRSQENFTSDALEAAQRGLERLRRQVATWTDAPFEPTDLGRDFDGRFEASINQDLDTPAGLRVLAEVPGSSISDAEKLSLVRRWDRFLALDLVEGTAEPNLPEEAGALMQQRDLARAKGDFETADALRARLASLGVDVVDTAGGSKVFQRRRS
jgi:cysteinyl-tRNA synthetase